MKNYLKFWGTRGSCPVSGPEYLHFGGNTSTLELCYDDIHIVFDAGTGIRSLGKVFVQEKVKKIDLFLSHTHWDHIQGFPFFDPIYQSDVTMTVWSPQSRCKELFNAVFAPEFFPVQFSDLKAKIQFKVYDAPVKIGPLTLSFHKVNHPGVTYGFKIQTPHQTIGYVTDNELPLDALIDFFKGCDLLIHEAQYFSEEYTKKKGWGHSSLMEVIDFVEKTKARHWLVTHHDPAHTDEDLKRLAKLAHQKSSVPSTWLRDGQIVELE
jgi:phosphoribosyl 1,2-cyclic phosphodiesterase